MREPVPAATHSGVFDSRRDSVGLCRCTPKFGGKRIRTYARRPSNCLIYGWSLQIRVGARCRLIVSSGLLPGLVMSYSLDNQSIGTVRDLHRAVAAGLVAPERRYGERRIEGSGYDF